MAKPLYYTIQAIVFFLLFIWFFGSIGDAGYSHLDKSYKAYEGGDYLIAVREFRLFLGRGMDDAIGKAPLADDAIDEVSLAAEKMSNAGYSQDFDEGLEAYEAGDYAAALREWRPLAEKGFAGAQYNLGALYSNGQGVTQDYKEAVKWYRLAAEQGNADAQAEMGDRYRDGTGVVLDHKEALKWFRLAAEQGNASGQSGLGVMYRDGQGVAQDYKEAMRWSRLAAEQGRVNAQYNLGRMYVPKWDVFDVPVGTSKAGVKRDMLYAYMWLNIAASNGHEKAAENRDAVAKMEVDLVSNINIYTKGYQMTASDISEAQNMSNECVKKNYKGCEIPEDIKK